jgi:phosphohistidine phosphatase
MAMDLILWRHADAEDGDDAPRDDLKRKLTPRGERQATRVALWLHRQMPEGVRILVSPAVRAQRTASKLEPSGRKPKPPICCRPAGGPRGGARCCW